MATIQVRLDTAQLRRDLDRVQRDLRALGNALPANSGLNRGFDNASRSAAGFGATLRTLGPAITAFATGATIRQLASFATAFTQIESRVRAVIPATQNAQDVIRRLADVSRETGASFESVSTAFQRFALNSDKLGFSQEEVFQSIKALQIGFAAYGATAQEAESATLQLTQAMAKGRLDGDELKAVLEAFPPLAKALADVLQVDVGALRDLGAEGKITGEVMGEALRLIVDGSEKAAESLQRTFGQSLQAVRTSVVELIGTVDNMTGATEAITGALDQSAEEITDFARSLQDGASAVTTFTFIGDQLDDAVNRWTGGYVDLRSAVESVLPTLDEIGSAAERGATFVTDAADAFQPYAENVADAAEQGGIFAGITEAFNGILGQTENAVGAAGISLNEMASATFTVAGAMEDVVPITEELAGALETVELGLQGVDSSAARHAERLKDIENAERLAEIGAENFARSILDDGGAVEKQIAGINDQFEQTAERAKAAAKAAKAFAADLGEFLLENSAAAAREAEAQDRLNEILEQQAKLREEIALQAEEVAGAIARAFDASEAEVRQFVENSAILLNGLGLEVGTTFDEIVQTIAQTFGVGATEISRFLNIASDGFRIFGLEVEDLFGRRLTDAIRLFGSLSDDTLNLIVDGARSVLSAVEGIFPAIGGLTESLFGAGQAGTAAFEGVTTAVQGSATAVEAAITQANSATSAFEGFAATASKALGFAAAGGTIAGLGAGLVSENRGAQGGASLGGAAGAGIGFAVGGPVGALVGGALGGIGGGLLGIGFGPSKKEQKEDAFEDTVTSAFEAIQRGAISTIQIIQEFGSKGDEVAESLNANLLALGSTLSGEVRTDFEQFGLGAQLQLNAVSEFASAAAGAISQEFGFSAIDVLAVLNSLPDGAGRSFTAVAENSRQVAEAIAQNFGGNVDDIERLLLELAGNAEATLGTITNVSDRTAIGLSQAFGGSVDDIRRLFAVLPDDTFGSFESLRANADQVASALAFSFGVSVDEVKEVILGIADSAGATFDEVQTISGEAAEGFVRDFDAASTSLSAIFADVSGISAATFAGIATDAQGNFSLIDESAQLAFDRMVIGFGGTSETVQTILGTIADSGATSFAELLASGDQAFAGLDDVSRQVLANVLATFGVTTDQISALLGVLPNDAALSAGGIQDAFSGALGNIEGDFGSTENFISGVLDAIFGDASRTMDGVSSESRAAADEALRAFLQSEGGIAGAFSGILGSANSALGSIASIAGTTASQLAGAFANAAAQAQSSFGKILAGAKSAAAAVNSIPKAPASGLPKNLALGGIIPGPVTLASSSPFSRPSFAAGGVLPGFTAIAGEAGPEAIVPLSRGAGGRLGVNAEGLGGGVRVFIIQGVDRTATDRLERQFLSLDASVEFRAGLAAEQLLLGAV